MQHTQALDVTVPPFPSGGRWREAPDEGPLHHGRPARARVLALRQRDAFVGLHFEGPHPSPSATPSPGGRGTRTTDPCGCDKQKLDVTALLPRGEGGAAARRETGVLTDALWRRMRGRRTPHPAPSSEPIAFRIDSGVHGASSFGWPPGLRRVDRVEDRANRPRSPASAAARRPPSSGRCSASGSARCGAAC